MNLQLIPQPQRIRMGRGILRLPDTGEICVSDGMFRDAADELCSFLDGYRAVSSTSRLSVETSCSYAGQGRASRAATAADGGGAPSLPSCVCPKPGVLRNVLTIVRGRNHKVDEYCLRISPVGIIIEAGTADGAFWAVQTLRQVVSQSAGGRLPVLSIKDWPDFQHRGLYYDVSRGRIPKLERLKELAEKLSHYKINQLQLYIEHTFRFRGHPEIGKDASPLTAEDIMELDEFCRDRHIELVPSLASFGHLSSVLKLPRYRHLAEDWGIGKYVSPDAGKLPEWQKRIAWSLSPANPAVYSFLESLFEEFLPLFSSEKFNVCCDETFDLGLGQSYGLCRKRGKGRVYLDHILRLRDIAAKYGKKIMFWGDIIRKYPELHRKIPGDVILLDWGYDHNHPFSRVKDFKKAGLGFYVCPGTGSWNSLFPRLPEAMANIRGFAAAGKRNGASGLLNTDWGDGGHYNFMELSWPEYLLGAEQAWNVKADCGSYAGRFCHVFLGSRSKDLSKALVELGDVAQLQVRKNRSIWQEIFFATVHDEIFRGAIVDAWLSRNGKISRSKIELDAALGRKTVRRLKEIRRVMVKYSDGYKERQRLSRRLRPTFRLHGDLVGRVPIPGGRDAEPFRPDILPYWIFAVDTMIHSSLKLTVLGKGGCDSGSNRRLLRSGLKMLMARFKVLWLARNRPSEIGITLDRYRRVLDSI